MKIEIHNIRYFVDVHQHDESLPYLIFLHGFMGSGRAFSPLINYCTPFCNPITIDLLGHGKTGRGKSPARFSADHQVADLDEIINQIADCPLYLHGYSMGGRLAIRYALAHQKKLRGLILESTNYGLEHQAEIKHRLQTDEERAEAIENDFQSFLDEWKTLPIFRHGISLPEEKMASYEQIQHRQCPEQMAKSLRGFGTAQMPSVKNKLPELMLPVLFIAGQADLKYAEIARSMYKKTPNSILSITPNAGHRVHFEHPKAFISAIQSFINKVPLQ